MIKSFLLAVLTIAALTSRVNSQDLIPANQKVLDSVKAANTGKVIFFNYWATWCKPCVDEFPDIMKINSEYKDKDFKLIFVSLDFGDDLKERTKDFLKKMNVDFDTYYNNFDKDDALINYMSKDWDGGIPGTFIYDKNGKLSKTFIGKTSYDEFKSAVKKLL